MEQGTIVLVPAVSSSYGFSVVVLSEQNKTYEYALGTRVGMTLNPAIAANDWLQS